MLRRLVKTLRVLAVLLPILAVLFAIPARKVMGDEMSPDFRQGEWVWILPLTPIRGDVVAMKDPMDPARVVLRRAIAGPGQKTTYEDGQLRVDVKRIRQQDMGTDGDDQIFQETMWSKPPARANNWLLRRKKDPVRWSAPQITVPDDSWYVLADARDNALDSRWWGPVAIKDILGVVRLRLGVADQWRSRVQFIDPIP